MYKVYQVLPGEELKSIAEKLDMEYQVLCELNGFLEGHELRAGENLVIPNNQANLFQSYRVKAGDNLYEIGRRYQTSAKDIALINGLEEDDYIYPNQELLIPRAGVQVYITEEGETLKNVSKKFKTTVEKLVMENENIYLLPEQLLVFKRENFL